MPELPEVEAARRALEAHCVGRRIARCAVADDTKVVLSDRVTFERAMVDRTIVAARRRGKNLWLRLDARPFPSFQFGMAGAIYIKGVAVTKYKRSAVKSTDEWPSKYSKFFVEPETVPPISELGPDALFEPISVDNFVESLSRKKIGIKALLLDQSFISGIGNWIADEVLYQSRTHPLQIASSLTRESCEALHHSIQEVVKYAVDVDADSVRFPMKWLFHHRWGKKPGKVDGKKIEFITAGGRTTAYVPELQKLTGTQSGKAVAADPGQVSKDGGAKEAEEDENDDDVDDDLKPRKKVAISRAARGKPSSRKTNLVQVSEDGGAKEVRGDEDDDDDLKPRKRVATSRAARGKQNKNATSVPSRKTGKITGGKKKPSVEHGSKDNVETMEPNKAVATSDDEHGLDKPTPAVHKVSEQRGTRVSSRKKSKPAKYQ